MYKKPLSNTETALGCILVLFIEIFIFLCWWALGGLIILIGWNLVIPTIFNGPAITFGQAFGLALIISILQSIFGARVIVNK
jgi:hypothetical protein